MLLNTINEYRSPEILIFQDDIHIDKYGEDVIAFKTDVEKAFKHLSKIHRGKRKECLDMSALLHEMLEQDFPELFATPPPGSSSIIVTHDTSQESGRKRSRSSVSSSGNTHDEAVLKSEVRSEKKVSRVSDSSSSSSIVKKEEANVRTILSSKLKVP